MTIDLRGKSFLKEVDFSQEEFICLINRAIELREEKRCGTEVQRLVGRNIALIFEKTSTRTRSAFEVGAHDQGAHVTYLGPEDSQLGHKESMKDTARVLGRMFDGIEYRGFAQDKVETLARYAGVPVWNGLTDQWHPTQMLADILTMLDHGTRPIGEICYCYLGDARNNTANSLLVTGALLGADVRLAAPDRALALGRGAGRGRAACLPLGRPRHGDRRPAKGRVGSGLPLHRRLAVHGRAGRAMGPPHRRTPRVPGELGVVAATGNPEVKFMHCLPALHNRETEVGEQIFERYGLSAVEVTEDVFESPASIVFDQAENRLHTVKALMVSTLVG